MFKSFYNVNSSFTRLELVNNLNSMYINDFKLIENKTFLYLNKNVYYMLQFNSNTILSTMNCLIKPGLLILISISKLINFLLLFSSLLSISLSF